MAGNGKNERTVDRPGESSEVIVAVGFPVDWVSVSGEFPRE